MALRLAHGFTPGCVLHDGMHWNTLEIIGLDGVGKFHQLLHLDFRQVVDGAYFNLVVFTTEYVGNQMLGLVKVDNTA